MRFVVTAGPTREPIDPVRYLSNRSSGKMGYAIAEAALEAGHEVTLISGPVNLARARTGAQFVSVTTSDEMYRRGSAAPSHDCDVFVMCAAVADYKPATVLVAENEEESDARSRSSWSRRATFSLPSRARARIRSLWSASPPRQTTSKRTRRKNCAQKNCDIIVANDVSRSGIRNGKLTENEVDDFLSKRRNEKNSARFEKKYRARTCKNNFKHARKMFDKKNVTITDTCK